MRRLGLTLVLLGCACDGVFGSLGADDAGQQGLEADGGRQLASDGGLVAMNDAGLVTTDAGEPSRDAGQSMVDAGITAPDAGPAMVEVFMATGHLGRTIMSCDDGLTWVNDRSDNPDGRCWETGPNYVECDHTPISGTGLDSGGGWFFTSFGWGFNGTARRTRDGKTWEIIRDGAWGGGITYSEGVVLWLAGGDWPISLDEGETWAGSRQAIPNGYFDSRTITRAGTKLAVSGDPVAGLFSRDSGRSWFLVDLTDSVVWSRNVVLAEGNGTLVTVSSRTDTNNDLISYTAVSTDDGKTWHGRVAYTGPDHSNAWSGLFFTGTEFVTFANSKKLTSADGVTWSSSTVSMPAAARGPIARAANGTYVSIPNNWGGYYEKQVAYRSLDGITWAKVDNFPGGHPITRLKSGLLPASACPR